MTHKQNIIPEYDIVVIGSGPGGQKAAVQGAKAGKKVAIIERERFVGGACVYQGTVPSKTLREAALTIINFRRSSEIFHFSLKENLEVSHLMQRLDQVLETHTAMVKSQLERNNIEIIKGKGKLLSKNQIEISSIDGSVSIVNCKMIIISTGSRPRKPPEVPIDHENIIDSDSVLSMLYLTKSMVVLGGGVIACEYASFFSLLGTKVTIIDRAERPLSFIDPELTAKFINNFERHGGTYLGGKNIQSVHWDGVSKVVTKLESGEVIESRKLLCALGRVANVENLGLKDVGIKQGKYGHILADENYQTNIPGIYAVGDVIGPPSLASCSMEQGRRAACHALSIDPGLPFEIVPIGIYSVPELASVGLDERQARELYDDVLVGRASFDEVTRSQIAGMQDGMLKMISRKSDHKLLGVQIVCEGATDLVHLGELALINGNSVSVFRENILNFPTLGEAYRIAAFDILNQK